MRRMLRNPACGKRWRKKSPAEAGLVCAKPFINDLLTLNRTRTDYFDFYAAIRLQASDQLRAGANFTLRRRIRALLDRVGFTLAFGVDAVRLDTFRDKVILDRLCTSLRKLQVVRIAADAVCVANCDDHFEADAGQFGHEVIQLRAAFRTQCCSVEVKQRICCKRHLLAGRSGRRRWCWRRGRSRRCGWRGWRWWRLAYFFWHQFLVAYAADGKWTAFDLGASGALNAPEAGPPAKPKRVHNNNPIRTDHIRAFARIGDSDVLLLGETYARDGHQGRGNEAQLDEFHVGAPHSRFENF